MGKLTTYKTGATRDSREGKFVFDKFLSMKVLRQFASYMHMNRIQSDGNLRDGDNWQKGISQEDYIESLFRHVLDTVDFHRQLKDRDRDGMIEGVAAVCGVMFNSMGWLHEWLKKNDPIRFDKDEITFEQEERRGTTIYTTKNHTGFCGQPFGKDQCKGCDDMAMCVSDLGNWKGEGDF